jgi:hypothetical protein
LEEQRLARLRGGVPADQVPDGVRRPAAAMLHAAKDAAPRRRRRLDEALERRVAYLPRHPAGSGGGIVTVDLDRLIVRLAIWQEAAQLAEYRHSLAMEAAEYLVAPRVKLADEARRIMRVLNAPPEARRNPLRTLSHHWIDAYHRSTTAAVGKFRGQPSPRDLD